MEEWRNWVMAHHYKAFNPLSMAKESATPFMWPWLHVSLWGLLRSDLAFNAGIPDTKELEEQIMADLAQPYVQGLTLLAESHSWILEFLPQANAFERVAWTKIFGLDRLHLGRNDARDTRQARASPIDIWSMMAAMIRANANSCCSSEDLLTSRSWCLRQQTSRRKSRHLGTSSMMAKKVLNRSNGWSGSFKKPGFHLVFLDSLHKQVKGFCLFQKNCFIFLKCPYWTKDN